MDDELTRDLPPGVVREQGRGQIGLGGMALFLWVLRRMGREQRRRDPESAGQVLLSEPASRVAARALELARRGREDETAVKEIVAAADGNRRALRGAERYSRQDGMHRERRETNRFHRLLVAALNRTPVAPASAEDEAVFRLLEAFASMPADQAWARLVGCQPELADLESEVRSGQCGDSGRIREEADHLPADESRELMAKQARLELDLMNRLFALLGPGFASTDPLCRSRVALEFAASYLFRLPDPRKSIAQNPRAGPNE
jgi:hypothetical protein